MGRPKGSKNKSKNENNVKSVTKSKTKEINPAIIKGTEPVNEFTLFHWNETIQKLNEMKEKGDWTEVPTVVIDTVPEEFCMDTESTTPTEVQPEPDSTEAQSKKGRKSTLDKYNHCERCGTIVKCEPFRADLNVLTGRADYHRQSPRYVKLCSKCSMELSNLVDKWFIEGGGKSKFDRE